MYFLFLLPHDLEIYFQIFGIGKFKFFWPNIILFLLLYLKPPHLLFMWILSDLWKLFLSNICICKSWWHIFKEQDEKVELSPTRATESIYWKVLLHFLHAAFYAMTLQSLRVRLIKLLSSCSAMWDTHCCGSHQSSPITCSIPAPDKWQPTSFL